MARRTFDEITAHNGKPWTERSDREDSILDAKEMLRVSRHIREERQGMGDNRDNGDASCLTQAAEHRRAATGQS